MLVCNHKSKLAFTELETTQDVNLPIFCVNPKSHLRHSAQPVSKSRKAEIVFEIWFSFTPTLRVLMNTRSGYTASHESGTWTFLKTLRYLRWCENTVRSEFRTRLGKRGFLHHHSWLLNAKLGEWNALLWSELRRMSYPNTIASRIITFKVPF